MDRQLKAVDSVALDCLTEDEAISHSEKTLRQCIDPPDLAGFVARQEERGCWFAWKIQTHELVAEGNEEAERGAQPGGFIFFEGPHDFGTSCPLSTYSSMNVDLHKEDVALQCPICGRKGLAAVLHNGPSGIRTATPPLGFFVRLAPQNAFEIACSTCRAVAFRND